ncbi:hypothetical protein FisN_17Hh100 [Fistulifera solaris]|uniref:Domain of unknown function at the cortex 1 domain-containing protein n=1 Tax=Fistulifera solaris TaxID=1519565 RepID=A0A1Z5JGP0_FISSO|nr:hypothetical protein FisN_17Hh100 [Fistulifera solaris]|eukprot:GAX13170.1 hypothetical protein FisN_17Hh100 [Fistulifera solaris]
MVVDSEESNHSSRTSVEKNAMSSSKKRGQARRSFVFFRPKDTPSPPTMKRSWRRRKSNSSSRHSIRIDAETSSTEDTEKELTDAMMRTTIVPTAKISRERKDEKTERQELQQSAPPLTEATAILQHSYLELLCGSSNAVGENTLYQRKNTLPDDPTIQESIECIFASQLAEGLPSLLMGDDEDDDDSTDLGDRLVAPSTLQQSLFKSRCHYILEGTPPPASKPKKQHVHSTLIHLQTMDSSGQIEIAEDFESSPSMSERCVCCRQSRPALDPKHWPQRPLLLRPTPGSGTKIKGIRFSGSSEYIWTAEKSVLTWPTYLKLHWGIPESSPRGSWNPPDVTMCDQCMILPINNGNETLGESLVTDFYTDLFEGTLLLRLRKSEGTTPQKYDDSIGYFANMNRRYQVVVRGRFRKDIRWTECLTGFELSRPCGKLPPKWMLNGALKVLSFFAPQLQAKIDTKNPSTMSPLGSTPQCLVVEESDSLTMSKIDAPQSEPEEVSKTLLGKASSATSSMQRARYRKKVFDKLFSQNSPIPVTDCSKLYTFEFLQHLINFDEFSVELGSVLGAIRLQELLDGQPLQIMATHFERRLWSFDIWHEMLVEDALRSDQA